MATVSTRGGKQTLTVINAVDNTPFNLPTQWQEIIKHQSNFEDGIRSLVRTGGIGKLQSGGIIKYGVYAKSTISRDIINVIDTATGLATAASMFGAQSLKADGTFGYIEPTTLNYGYFSIQLSTLGKFAKILISKNDIKNDGIVNLVQNQIASFKDGQHEKATKLLKDGFTSSFGKLGDAAKQFKYVLPTTGIGVRVKSKTYTVDAKGGQEAYIDIDSQLEYIAKIGREDGTGVEVLYPFSRGIPKKGLVIVISPEMNRALTLASDGFNTSGSMSGLAVNKSSATVSSIFNVPVKILNMPPKSGGDVSEKFNWFITTTGTSGAAVFPMYWKEMYLLRPHSEGLELVNNILEATAGEGTFKALQPELMFASYKVKV